MSEQKILPLSVRMPVEWSNAIKQRALDKGVTLTDHVCEVLLADLPNKVRKSLPERQYLPTGRPLKVDGGEK